MIDLYRTGTVAALLLASAPANASLTFYTDEAAWQAAVSGDTIGALTSPATVTRDQVTVGLLPNGTCCTQDIYSTSITQSPFTSLSATFASVGINYGTPTLDTNITVDLPVAIDGFAVHGVRLPMSDAGLTLNGQAIPDPTFGFADFAFLGVVGDITSLDFQSYDCIHCDYMDRLIFSNIVVATGTTTIAAVTEPPVWPLLLFGAAAIYRRKTKTQEVPT